MSVSQDTNPILFATKATFFPLCHATSQIYLWTRITYVVYFVTSCNKPTKAKEERKIGGCGEQIWVEKEILFCQQKFSLQFSQKHSYLGMLTLLSSGFTTTSPLSFSLGCSDNSLFSISRLNSFPSFGSRSSLPHQFSSYTNNLSLAVNYMIKFKWLSKKFRILHAWAPPYLIILPFVLHGTIVQGPLAYLFLVFQYVIHIVTSNICPRCYIVQEILPTLCLVSRSASFIKVRLSSHHLWETISSSSTFQLPVPFPRQSLGHLSETFTMALNHIPFYNLMWLSCFSELAIRFWKEIFLGLGNRYPTNIHVVSVFQQ